MHTAWRERKVFLVPTQPAKRSTLPPYLGKMRRRLSGLLARAMEPLCRFFSRAASVPLTISERDYVVSAFK